MPSPGMTVMPESKLAKPSWPLALAASMAWSCVMPAGSCLPTTPEKMMSVAVPNKYGPTTLSPTPITVRTRTRDACSRSGRSWPSSRRADGQKSRDFSAGIPAAIAAPGPRIGGPAGRARCGLLAHAAASAGSWDATISA